MNRFLRPLRVLLCGGVQRRPGEALFSAQSRACERALVLVRLFYTANLFLAGWRLVERAPLNAFGAFDPLWPLFWADGRDVQSVVLGVFTANAIVAAIAAIVPADGVVRWLAFFGALAAGALENSFGSIGHAGHAWVWIMFFLALLPSGGPDRIMASRVVRQRYLQIFWTSQFAVLMFYSMSGCLKLASVPAQWSRGEVCAVGPEALARHIANRVLQTQSEPLLAEWLIDNISISWVLFLGTLYLESASVLVAFRPALHRVWGSAISLLHLGIGLSMEIWFVPPILALSILLVGSPFHSEGTTWRQMFWQLPGMELVQSLLRPRHAIRRVRWIGQIALGRA